MSVSKSSSAVTFYTSHDQFIQEILLIKGNILKHGADILGNHPDFTSLVDDYFAEMIRDEACMNRMQIKLNNNAAKSCCELFRGLRTKIMSEIDQSILAGFDYLSNYRTSHHYHEIQKIVSLVCQDNSDYSIIKSKNKLRIQLGNMVQRIQRESQLRQAFNDHHILSRLVSLYLARQTLCLYL